MTSQINKYYLVFNNLKYFKISPHLRKWLWEVNETLIIIAFVSIRNDIKHQKNFLKVSLKTKNLKNMKILLKICQKLIDLQNKTKKNAKTNQSINIL